MPRNKEMSSEQDRRATSCIVVGEPLNHWHCTANNKIGMVLY